MQGTELTMQLRRFANPRELPGTGYEGVSFSTSIPLAKRGDHLGGMFFLYDCEQESFRGTEHDRAEKELRESCSRLLKASLNQDLV
jgi:hypothetical protein